MRHITAFLVTVSFLDPGTTVRVLGFASYMTSSSNCLIELDPSEVVMNHKMVAAPAWRDALDTIQIVVTKQDGSPLATQEDSVEEMQKAILLQKYPATLHVRVTGTEPDAQYVLQMLSPDDEHGGGMFEDGQCDGNARYVGRVNDGGTLLTVDTPSASLLGGWASGHEAVKLLPGFTFGTSIDRNNQMDQKNKAPGGNSKIAPEVSSWTEFLHSPVGCASVQLSAMPAEIHGRSVLPSTTQQSASLSIQQSLPDHAYVISLEWDRQTTQIQDIVVEATVGGQWQEEDASCPGAQRRIITTALSEIDSNQPEVVGTLQIHKDFDDTVVTLQALFAVSGDNHNDVLYMPPKLKINVDPQKQMERQRRKDPADIREQLQVHHAKDDGRLDVDDLLRNTSPRRRQRQPSSDQKEESMIFARKRTVPSDSQEDDKPGLFGKKKIQADEERRMDRRRYRTDHQPVPPDTHQHKPKEVHHHAFLEDDRPAESSQRYLASHRNDEYLPSVSFDSRYFSAMVFLIGGMVATIQTCRFASMRVSKGRRAL